MSFNQSISGLKASQTELEVTSNNIANSSTVGFKKGKAQFSDTYANSRIGLGTQTAAISQDFGAGTMKLSNDPLHMAIDGDSFFRLQNANGEVTYSRNGMFGLDKEKFIVNVHGQKVTGYQGAEGMELGALQLRQGIMEPRASTEVKIGMNLNSSGAVITAPFNRADENTFSHRETLRVNDSLGNSHAVDVFFTKTAANTWQMRAFSGTNSVIPAGGTHDFTFNGNGSLASGDTAVMSLAPANGAAPINFYTTLTGSTQYAEKSAISSLVQDGYASGNPTGHSVDRNGVVRQTYSNDQSIVIGRVALVSFANNGGLRPVGNDGFHQTGESGEALVGTAGTGPRGTLKGSAYEASNVDVTDELVNLIVAQRSYQANVQSIKAESTVTQAILSI